VTTDLRRGKSYTWRFSVTSNSYWWLHIKPGQRFFGPFCPPQNAYKSPVMVIYKKKFLTLCYISRPNGLQNKISSFQAQFWKNQARSQVLGFGGKNTSLGGKIFVFIVCLKQVFLRTTKFGGRKRDFGGTSPECTHVCRSGQKHRQKIFRWKASCLWGS